jgi:hypothetical protein
MFVGKVGIITTCFGEVVDSEFDRDHRISWGSLYTVAFDWSELYEGKPFQNSKFYADLHENWLEAV